jgi:hypothetical protein
MEHLAVPVASEIPVQLWAAPPLPRVIVTGWPLKGAPFEVTVVLMVSVCPDMVPSGAETDTVVGALVTTTVLEPPLGLRAGCDGVEPCPPKLPESV